MKIKKTISIAIAAMLALGNTTAYAADAGAAQVREASEEAEENRYEYVDGKAITAVGGMALPAVNAVASSGENGFYNEKTWDRFYWSIEDDGTLSIGCQSSYSYGTMPDFTVDEVLYQSYSYYRTGERIYTTIKPSPWLNNADIIRIRMDSDIGVIGKNAFKGCTSLTTIEGIYRDFVEGELVEVVMWVSIGESAFEGCTALTEIPHLPKLTSIGKNAFKDTPLVSDQDSKIKYVGNWIVDCDESIITEEIREGTVGIADGAFDGCSSLTALTIPNSVKYIGASAFEGCSSLTSVNIPSGVTAVNASTFKGCTLLSQADLPASVTYIGDSAFEDCTSLSQADLPASVTYIGNSAFEDCTNLSVVSIPGSVTEVGGSAFKNSKIVNDQSTKIKYVSNWIVDCDESIVTEAIDPNTVRIANSAFRECSSLTSITIPDSVTDIGYYAFRDCSSLKSVRLPQGTAEIKYNVFGNCTSLTSIELPSGLKELWGNVFRGCTSLADIKLPESLDFMGGYSFEGCSALKSIKLPGNLTVVHSGVFQNCTSLTEFTINPSWQSIPQYFFEGCTSLSDITIPENIQVIGLEAFKDTALTAKQSGKVKYADKWAVECDPSAETVYIKADTVGIADYTFSWLTPLLTDIYYGGSETEWENMRSTGRTEWTKKITVHYNSPAPGGTLTEIVINAPDDTDTGERKVTVNGGGITNKELTITDGKLDISGLPDGTYTFTFSAKNCAPRDYGVTVSGGAAKGLEKVELHLYGDINGDGEIDIMDIVSAKNHCAGKNKLSGYDLAVVNVNGDTTVDILDIVKLKNHAKGRSKLW